MTLSDLKNIVVTSTQMENFLHAQGSGWAFSYPAYCEGTIINTDHLDGFEALLQGCINQTNDPRKFRVAVKAGTKVRHLYTALASGARDGAGNLLFPGPPNSNPPPGGIPTPLSIVLPPGLWTLPTLGGAGGQSIAGAISTGTHGGDVSSPPMSDMVLAMLMVGSGGELRLVQRLPDGDQPPVVDVPRLTRELAPDLGPGVEVRESSALDAAVVSVGRFGTVYAYVLEVVNEDNFAIVENRKKSNWNGTKATMLQDVANAATSNRFLQIVISPYKRRDGDRTCYVTTHDKVPGNPRDPSQPPMDPMGTPIPYVIGERSRERPAVLQSLCAITITPELLDLQRAIKGIAWGILTAPPGPPITIPLATPFFDAAESLGRIGEDHRLGDAVADVLNSVNPQLTEMTTTALLDMEQHPWTVKGTRFEIADFFDYDNDCYRGDSVELFFEVNGDLPQKIEHVLEVFDNLSANGLSIGAYVSLRFMAWSRALLALARWNPTCSVEISMLRGLHGNSTALSMLQGVALANDGFIHWGQQNDIHQHLNRDQFEARFGNDLTTWRNQLQDLEQRSMLFSTKFTRDRWLEVSRTPDWTNWVSITDFSAQNSPCIASAWGDQPLEIFSQNGTGVILSRQRHNDGTPDSGWTPVPGDPVTGRPLAIRSVDGRIELFVLKDERIKHCWQGGRPGGPWVAGLLPHPVPPWDTLGGDESGRIHSDPTLAAHSDGRLELFAQGNPENWQLFHCWAHLVNAPWSDFTPRGHEPIASAPSACHRNRDSDQILVVATSPAGLVLEKHQVGPSGDSGWTEWAEIVDNGGRSLDGAFGSGGGSPIAVDVLGTVHVLAFDNRGQVQETLDTSDTIIPQWQSWQPLPSARNARAGADLGQLERGSRLVTVVADRLYLFALSLIGEALVCELQPGVGWRDWQSLGGEFAGVLAAGCHADGRTIEVVGKRQSDGRLMARRQVGPGVW